MRHRFRFSLATAMIVMTVIAGCLGLATAVVRGRTAVVLKHVDRATVAKHWWIDRVIPGAATDITVWYVPYDNVYSRFHLRKEDLETWVSDKSQRLNDVASLPKTPGTIMFWHSIEVMDEDGVIRPRTKWNPNVRVWVTPWGSRGGARVVFYDPATEIVQMSIVSFVPQLSIEQGD